jgi:hypothetical protein
VVVETAGGVFVAKLRGAGQGVAALVSEIIVAALAERLGLPVPERALVELAKTTPSDDGNDELSDLLRFSVGLNVGFRWLDDAHEPTAEYLRSLEDDFVARLLWLDGLTMNPDRSPTNPNILVWQRQPWLIDHGAALPFQHSWALVTEDSPRAPTDYTRHVFHERLALLPGIDAVLAPQVTRAVLAQAVAAVPEEFFTALHPSRAAARTRAAYHAFLWKRLKAPRPFVTAVRDRGAS